MATWSEKALATVLGIETIAGKGPTGKAGRAALRAGANAIVSGTVTYAPIAGRGAAGLIMNNPITAGVGLGLGALATPPGQQLLEAAAARGQSDRVRLQQAIDQYIFEQTVLPFREQQSMVGPTQSTIQVSDFGKGGRESRGGAPNQHNLAVKAGMKALKASKFDGPKGKLRKPKLSFSKVNKTISRIKKRAKVSKKGATGVIARAVKRYT